jgi:CarD family transcriptional regulator
MTLRAPTAKITAVGMRKLAEAPIVKRCSTPSGRPSYAPCGRGGPGIRGQDQFRNIARLPKLRDLFRSDTQPEQSYSERQLYEAALDRLSREISAVQRITETEAVKEIEAALAKGPRRGKAPEGEEVVIEEEAA